VQTQGDTPIRLKRRPIAQSIENLDQLMNLEKGRMSRDLFWDQDIYEQEMERIFARCWLFGPRIPDPQGRRLRVHLHG
jgi:ethylbenzene dioxygenase alpha subunit